MKSSITIFGRQIDSFSHLCSAEGRAYFRSFLISSCNVFETLKTDCFSYWRTSYFLFCLRVGRELCYHVRLLMLQKAPSESDLFVFINHVQTGSPLSWNYLENCLFAWKNRSFPEIVIIFHLAWMLYSKNFACSAEDTRYWITL